MKPEGSSHINISMPTAPKPFMLSLSPMIAILLAIDLTQPFSDFFGRGIRL